MPEPCPPDLLKRLVDAYCSDPGSPELAREVDDLAWESFHDPWEIAPGHHGSKVGMQRQFPRNEGDAPIPPRDHAGVLKQQGHLPLDGFEGELPPSSIGDLPPQGLELVKEALGYLGLDFVARERSLRFHLTPRSEANPLPSVQVRFLQDPSLRRLVVEGRGRVDPSHLCLEDALWLCNRFNRGHGLARAIVDDSGMTVDRYFILVPGCHLDLGEGVSLRRMAALLARAGRELDGFWVMVRAEIRKRKHSKQ